MKYLPLVWAALVRRKLRTILTLLSVTAAFTLFGVTMGTDAAFQKMVDVINRSVVVIGARFGDDMTDAMGQQIARMPNVAAVSAAGAVFGYYRNPKNRAGIMIWRVAFSVIRLSVSRTVPSAALSRNNSPAAISFGG